MSSANSVQPNRRERNGPVMGPLRRAQTRVVSGDVFGLFVAEAAKVRRIRRLVLVSPWMSERTKTVSSVERLLDRALDSDATVVLLTRPVGSAFHGEIVRTVLASKRGHVITNPRLHAKLYVCEAENSAASLAIIGSANMTDSSRGLHELALLVRPYRSSRVVRELGSRAVRHLCAQAGTRQVHRKQTMRGRHR